MLYDEPFWYYTLTTFVVFLVIVYLQHFFGNVLGSHVQAHGSLEVIVDHWRSLQVIASHWRSTYNPKDMKNML
jgi:hypothetical protein